MRTYSQATNLSVAREQECRRHHLWDRRSSRRVVLHLQRNVPTDEDAARNEVTP
jgi:hypothetical protein